MLTKILILVVAVSILVSCNAAECESPCTAPDGEDGYCVDGKCLSHVEEEVKENLTFSITVKYPGSQLQKHGGAALYIRGNGLGLSWLNGLPLLKADPNTWKINITYKYSPDGYHCQSCINQNSLPGGKLQYRIFIDDRDNMLGANFAIDLPVSMTSSYFDTMPSFESFPWFYQKTGTLRNIEVQSKYIGGFRNLTVYTPPSFEENIFKIYSTIIAFDFSMMIAKFLKNNYEGPILPSAVSDEYIILGFGEYAYTHDEFERTNLLTPDAGPFLQCINGSFHDFCDGCIPVNSTHNVTEYFWYLRHKCCSIVKLGGQGDQTLDFLVKEAIPTAKQQLNDRLQSDKLGVIGYSLGGLMACYAGWTRPDVFSVAACQSPSFWWPYNENVEDVEFSFLNKTMKDPAYLTKLGRFQRIYLDAGGNEDGDPFRLTQSVIEVGESLGKVGNFKLNENLWVSVDPKKDHTFVEWGKRMHQVLSTLYPAKGDPRMPDSQAPFVG